MYAAFARINFKTSISYIFGVSGKIRYSFEEIQTPFKGNLTPSQQVWKAAQVLDLNKRI